jgi:FlaA1/EpsC-like NDP-sugar epimerase
MNGAATDACASYRRVRERNRLTRSIDTPTSFSICALKHVESCEYNPFEAIKTNIVAPKRD